MIPLWDSHGTGKFPFWVVVIIALNIYVFFLELTAPNIEDFILQYALISTNVNFSNWTTLTPFITSQFLHGDFLHIISNMWFFKIFGDNVEERVGFFLFPLFYLVCGVIGGLAQYILSPDSTIPMLGASGAVAGVLGAYFAWFSHHSVKTLIPVFGWPIIINVPAGIMLFYWIAIQILSGVTSFGVIASDVGGVAYFAHIGGFVYGWVFAKFFNPRPTLQPVREEYPLE